MATNKTNNLTTRSQMIPTNVHGHNIIDFILAYRLLDYGIGVYMLIYICVYQ